MARHLHKSADNGGQGAKEPDASLVTVQHVAAAEPLISPVAEVVVEDNGGGGTPRERERVDSLPAGDGASQPDAAAASDCTEATTTSGGDKQKKKKGRIRDKLKKWMHKLGAR